MAYRSSFLSERAQSLLWFQHPNEADLPEPTNDYIIDFDLLPDSLIAHLHQEQYVLAIANARPLIHRIAICFNTLSTHELYNQHDTLLAWLSDPYEYLELHSRLQRPEASEKLLIGLRLTALLDFSLNTLLWKPQTKSPNMLKDTLQSPRLTELLGTNCILMLKLLFGSVYSLNLRNILWHGFLTPTDMLRMDKDLLPFIFALILSIGNRLKIPEFSQKFQPTTRRPSSLHIIDLCDTLISVDHLNLPSTTCLMDLASHHPISSTSNMEYIKFIDLMFHSESPRYLDILCLSLVCLSIIIRCQFANLIQWTEGVLTSEDRFFLTLDSIIEFNFADILSRLPSVDLMANLNEFFNLHLMDILCDVLSAQNGPRLRDKLSHGELWQDGPTTEFVGNELVVRNDVKFCTVSKLIYSCLAASLISGSSDQVDECLINSTLLWIQYYDLRFNLCDQFVRNITNLNHNYSLIKSQMSNFRDYGCPVNQASSSHVEFESTFLLWFPQCSYSDLDQRRIPDSGHHWINIITWSYLMSSTCWSLRPTALLNRLNLVLQKYNQAFCLTDQHFNCFTNVDLDSLPTRRYNTFVRSVTCLDGLQNLAQFLLNLTTCIWSFWFGGFCRENIQEKLDFIGSKCWTNSQGRNLLMEYLDKMADKLIMWITKSQWESITEFFDACSLPKPKS